MKNPPPRPPKAKPAKAVKARKELPEPQPARAAAYVAIYPMLLQIAKDHGYSLTVHGSLHRDMDLVAIPWIEAATNGLTLIKAFKRATRAVTWSESTDRKKYYRDCSPQKKPHGRVAYSLHVTRKGMYGGYLDISVMPLGLVVPRDGKKKQK